MTDTILAVAQPAAAPVPAPMASAGASTLNPFLSIESFAAAQRMAQLLSAAPMVPEAYRGESGFPNCVVAMEFAYRTGASIFTVMQNTYSIHGRISWSSPFMTALINQSGRFEDNLAYEYENEGEGDGYRCRAYARSRVSGEWRHGGWVSIAMAKAEGWYQRSGSKWKTMPEQMLAYRAAAFFARMHCPEIIHGMHTDDEAADMTAEPSAVHDERAARLAAKLAPAREPEEPVDVVEGQVVDQGQAPPSAPPPKRAGEVVDAPAQPPGAPVDEEPAAVAAEPAPADEAPEPPPEEQPEEAETPEPAPDIDILPTTDEVVAMIAQAQNRDDLDAARDLFRHFSASARKRLTSVLDARAEQLGEL